MEAGRGARASLLYVLSTFIALLELANGRADVGNPTFGPMVDPAVSSPPSAKLIEASGSRRPRPLTLMKLVSLEPEAG